MDAGALERIDAVPHLHASPQVTNTNAGWLHAGPGSPRVRI
jgi:hypothetical protein